MEIHANLIDSLSMRLLEDETYEMKNQSFDDEIDSRNPFFSDRMKT